MYDTPEEYQGVRARRRRRLAAASGTARRRPCPIGAAIEAEDAPSPPDRRAAWSAPPLLGLRLFAEDEGLQEAIRQLARAGGEASGVPSRQRAAVALDGLADQRRKILDLYYSGTIDVELFAEEEGRLTKAIEALREELERVREDTAPRAEVAGRFQEVLGFLQELNLDEIWAEAAEREKRVLVEELVDVVAIFPDHLKVTVNGAPSLNVTLGEVGLKEGWWQFVGVGGGI
jgi:hypothetical protein